MSEKLERFIELTALSYDTTGCHFSKQDEEELEKLKKEFESSLIFHEMFKQTDTSLYDESLQSLEKLRSGFEPDAWDNSNFDMIEMVLKNIIQEMKKQ